MTLAGPTEISRSETAIRLRPVTAADRAFLIELYATTRSDELALVPWNEEQRRAFVEMQFQAQHGHYEQYFPRATRDIVLEGDRAIGRLYVERSEQEIKIIDLTLLPADRNRGIGGYLMKDILEDAAHSRRAVSIYVESYNPSQRFFQRLGFVATEQSGIYVYLQWFPQAGESRNSAANLRVCEAE